MYEQVHIRITILKQFLVLLEILNTLSTKTFQVYSVISETCIIN